MTFLVVRANVWRFVRADTLQWAVQQSLTLLGHLQIMAKAAWKEALALLAFEIDEVLIVFADLLFLYVSEL
jgi:hypothetical protein